MALPIKPPGSGFYASRRTLMKWGLLGLGTVAITAIPKALTAQPSNSIKTLTFNANDIGILNFALLQEELEVTFYTAAANSGKLTNTRELDYVRALVVDETTHAQFLRKTLGTNVAFQTSDISINRSGLADLLTDRNRILNAIAAIEDAGIHTYNGGGVSLTNPTFLLAAGSIVSVEARHVAGVRGLLGRSFTEPDSERAVSDADLVDSLNPVRGRAYDELYTPRQQVGIIRSLNILNNPLEGTLFA